MTTWMKPEVVPNDLGRVEGQKGINVRDREAGFLCVVEVMNTVVSEDLLDSGLVDGQLVLGDRKSEGVCDLQVRTGLVCHSLRS